LSSERIDASLVLAAADAASSKKAESVVILDVSEQLVITDHFLICSANSDRQVRTIADEIEKRLRETASVKPYRREGETEAMWVLLDYVDFVVHVFQHEARDYYDLERLWSDAPRVPYEENGGVDEPAAAEAT
jgi:ribosome-associated protein